MTREKMQYANLNYISYFFSRFFLEAERMNEWMSGIFEPFFQPLSVWERVRAASSDMLCCVSARFHCNFTMNFTYYSVFQCVGVWTEAKNVRISTRFFAKRMKQKLSWRIFRMSSSISMRNVFCIEWMPRLRHFHENLLFFTDGKSDSYLKETNIFPMVCVRITFVCMNQQQQQRMWDY